MSQVINEDFAETMLATTYATSFHSKFMIALKAILRCQLGITNFNVTRRSYALSSTRDSWSGWRTKTSFDSTIEMIIFEKGARKLLHVAGPYVLLDAVGVTEEDLKSGDMIVGNDGTSYGVEIVQTIKPGGRVIYHKCQMRYKELYEADFSSPTWTKTRASDPRYRTKDWLDTYIRTSQITKDDDSTLASFASMFSDPPYYLPLEFRAGQQPVQGLYVIENPVSDALTDITRGPYAYNEKVPIHIVTVNSLGCSGTTLAHKMTAELRYIFENYPLGSVRSFENSQPIDQDLGGMTLYDVKVVLGYKRNVTT